MTSEQLYDAYRSKLTAQCVADQAEVEAELAAAEAEKAVQVAAKELYEALGSFALILEGRVVTVSRTCGEMVGEWDYRVHEQMTECGDTVRVVAADTEHA